jgi:hypothetical protein
VIRASDTYSSSTAASSTRACARAWRQACHSGKSFADSKSCETGTADASAASGVAPRWSLLTVKHSRQQLSQWRGSYVCRGLGEYLKALIASGSRRPIIQSHCEISQLAVRLAFWRLEPAGTSPAKSTMKNDPWLRGRHSAGWALTVLGPEIFRTTSILASASITLDAHLRRGARESNSLQPGYRPKFTQRRATASATPDCRPLPNQEIHGFADVQPDNRYLRFAVPAHYSGSLGGWFCAAVRHND